MTKKKIVVAMSGGVDSTTVAAMLKKEGHDVIGITMQLLDYTDAEGGCCSFDHVVDARRTSEEIGIPHYVVNFTDEFKEYVLKDYVSQYESGKTPIPCIPCNQFVKFDLLLKRALELGADYLATGHYARIEEKNGIYTLRKAHDESKDQTYFLYTLGQHELSKLIFPLGDLTKVQVRERAREFKLRPAEKPDSTGVCFAPTGNYRDYLKARSEFQESEGEIVNTEGEVLGTHKGVFSYTVGQRRGLGIATGKPMYVTRIEPGDNRVIVGDDNVLYRDKLIAKDLSWVDNSHNINEISATLKVNAKIRYRHSASEATVKMHSQTDAVVEFTDRQRAITPGQAIVFYQGEEVLGGGSIDRVI
jgi:tRNA-uridine 2-sulfurtransferase